jgi:predicted CoA-binding protein
MIHTGGDRMKKGNIVETDEELKKILTESHTIAVLGLSPKPERDSNKVARYMKEKGYRIIPVRPGQTSILDEKACPGLTDISEPVDIIDVFRNPEQVMSHVREAVQIRPRVFWMQLGIENREAASILTEAGIDVVMNRCIKVEHERLRI